jgi:pimeloyl-ACP methyl ester carboxylesterase
MPIDKINGINLYWELTGQGSEPLVMVHGSWGNHHNWNGVVKELSKSFRVLTYDRRGHSQSERLKGQGSIEEDVADLIALIEFAGIAPAHIIGNSGGAAIVLKTAIKRSEVFSSLVVHEPPLFGLLRDLTEAQTLLETVNSRIKVVADLIEKGENEEAAKRFVETIAFGPGAWQGLPSAVQQTFVYNAPTFLDETKDPDGLQLDLSKLSQYKKPALLTQGAQSPPFFLMVIDQLVKALPHAKQKTFEGAGHVPHLSHPELYVATLREFCLANT